MTHILSNRRRKSACIGNRFKRDYVLSAESMPQVSMHQALVQEKSRTHCKIDATSQHQAPIQARSCTLCRIDASSQYASSAGSREITHRLQNRRRRSACIVHWRMRDHPPTAESIPQVSMRRTLVQARSHTSYQIDTAIQYASGTGSSEITHRLPSRRRK